MAQPLKEKIIGSLSAPDSHVSPAVALEDTDGGVTWKTQESPAKGWLTSVLFDSSNRGWITYDDGFLVSEDAGGTCKSVPIDGQYFLGKLLKVDKTLWAIGQSAVLKQAGGLKWTKIDSLVPSTATGTTSGSTAH